MPPVILAGLQRLVGPRQAEFLAVSGILISPRDAHRVGLVDEVAPAEQVIERALTCCRQLVALPAEAMTITRRQARADLVALFEANLDAELKLVAESWWSTSTQNTLRAVADRLKKKAG